MADEQPTILIVGTLDTKESETLYLRAQILSYKTCRTKILDTGRQRKSASALRIPEDELVLFDKQSGPDPDPSLSRGDFINAMIERCKPIVSELVSSKAIYGIVAAAGSSGSSLATALMRNCCPVGFPKLMVSTMASGDIKPYIEETDISMMYSVVDIAGINSILKRILGNAAGAIVGMTTAYFQSVNEPAAPESPTTESTPDYPRKVAITMFGVTTPCVDQIRQILTAPPHDVLEFEIYVFHATGSGGKAMERLIREGQIDAVIDLTTTELADELMGGVLTAGPERLEAGLQKGIPYLLSVGACDMVNFGPRASVPEKYQNRNLHVHNPTVTLMRTTPEENKKIGQTIAEKIKKHAADPERVRVLLPTEGVSMIDHPGQPFHDPDADAELFEAIEDGLLQSEPSSDVNDNKPSSAAAAGGAAQVEVERYPVNVNDEQFAQECARTIVELMRIDPRRWRLANQRRRRWSFDHGASVTGYSA